jgi:hypothetical protein
VVHPSHLGKPLRLLVGRHSVQLTASSGGRTRTIRRTVALSIGVVRVLEVNAGTASTGRSRHPTLAVRSRAVSHAQDGVGVMVLGAPLAARLGHGRTNVIAGTLLRLHVDRYRHHLTLTAPARQAGEARGPPGTGARCSSAPTTSS